MFFATVNRGSIMARIHWWSVMIYGSLQAQLMETTYNSHIHRYGTSIFGKIVVNISKSINNNNQIFWRLWNILRFDMPSVLLASKAGLLIIHLPLADPPLQIYMIVQLNIGSYSYCQWWVILSHQFTTGCHWPFADHGMEYIALCGQWLLHSLWCRN